MLPAATRSKLEAAARGAAGRAYAPYSRFPVGAAVLAADGSIYTGCNVENASYGLTVCAERIAIFNAVAQGARAIAAIAVYTPTPGPTMPCGACRQVLREFGGEALVICCSDARSVESALPELLPNAFGPESL